MSKKTPLKPGRKRIKFNDQDYENIEKWAGDGLSETQIATLLGCSISTITRTKKRNEQFEHAIKKGRYKAVQKVANKVYENAMEGKETSAIFFLKNRDPENWKDRQDFGGITLNLGEVLGHAKDRIIDITPKALNTNKKRVAHMVLDQNATKDKPGTSKNNPPPIARRLLADD